MVEISIIPICGIVAGRTVRTESTAVFVIVLVAGVTILRRAHELLIQMTGFARHFGMLAN